MRPKHDITIARLLKEGKIRVEEDQDDLVWDRYDQEWKPRTKIYFRNDVSGQVYEACLREDSDGYPRLKCIVNGKRVQLLAHRIVWVAFFGPTMYEIDHRDQDRANYNIWNLRRASRMMQVRNRFGPMQAHLEGLGCLSEEGYIQMKLFDP